MNELALLQAVRLKGRVRLADLATTLNVDETSAAALVKALADAGLLIEGKAIRTSPEGRDRLAELLTEERKGIDGRSFARTYDEFRSVNREFKELVHEWQLRDGEANDHADAEYDAAVLSRLDDVHLSVESILAEAVTQVPRLAIYAAKLSTALRKIRAGDSTWFTRPVIDSYHTVWFELHEELIGAAGLSRVEEAVSGHAE